MTAFWTSTGFYNWTSTGFSTGLAAAVWCTLDTICDSFLVFSSDSFCCSSSRTYSASIYYFTFNIYNWASAFLLESSCFLLSLARFAFAAAFLAAAAFVS